MEKQINLNTLSVQELKAMAYDVLATLEQAQKNLQSINQVIAEKSKEQPLEVTSTEEV